MLNLTPFLRFAHVNGDRLDAPQQVNNTIPRTFVNILLLFNISQVRTHALGKSTAHAPQVWNVHEQTEYCRVSD